MKYPDDFINKVICGDCLEVMKYIPDGVVDLVFADPPFNIGKQYGVADDRRDDYEHFINRFISESFRALKPTGSFYLMTIPKHLDWKLPIMAKHGVFINIIIWRNVSASHGKRSFWGEYQPIALYGKTEDYIFNTYAEKDKIGVLRFGGYSTEPKGQFKDRWDDIPFIYAGSIKHKEAVIVEGTNKKAHPCQMPVKLASRGIGFSTNQDAIVLDPFLGSGTTAVACKQLGRRFIGIEINPDYCKIAEDRLRQEELF